MPQISVFVGPTIVLPLAGLTGPAGRDLRRRLTFRNPEWRPGSKTVPEFLVEFEEIEKKYIRLPRGAISLVREILDRHQYTVTWRTYSVVSRSTVHLDPLAVDPGLRDYQLTAARALLSRVQGVFECPTGGGKTRTVSAAMVASREPAIVFVHSEDLLHQWVDALARLGTTARILQGKDSDTSPLQSGELAVAMVQTIGEHLTRFSPVLQSAGCAVFDEVHHITCDSWRLLAAHLPARYRWGCTATKDRDDGLGFLIDLLIGPTVSKVSTKELISRGFLSAPRFLPIESGWAPSADHYFASVVCPNPRCKADNRVNVTRFLAKETICRLCKARLQGTIEDKPRLDYTSAQTDVAADPGVQAKVAEMVALANGTGRSVLVLVPRREAVAQIAEALRLRGISAVGVTSGLGAKRRREAIERTRDGTYAAIVATTLADEGLDIPRLDFGINLMSGKAAGRARQRTGRLLRPEGAPPLQVELVHGGEEYHRQWMRRMSAYVKEYGRSSIIQVDPGQISDLSAALGIRTVFGAFRS